MEETLVIIVGAGPSGLATSACLNVLSIPNIVLEKEDCYASLWQKRAYDRLKLHLGKQFCELPLMPFAPNAPTFVPRKGFVNYLENYMTKFEVRPVYNSFVESAFYDKVNDKWTVIVKNMESKEKMVYVSKFLVVACGENSEGVIPNVLGLDSFKGNYIHSNKYENGKNYGGKNVLVVGCGNSGLEISYDLSNFGARVSLVSRSPVHVLTKNIVYIGMLLLSHNLPRKLVDSIVVKLSKIKHGDTSKFGIHRPKQGPFYLKDKTGRSPTIDVGAIDKIKSGQIKVFPEIKRIKGKEVEFDDGRTGEFDDIIFATGYRSTVRYWLKEGYNLFGENGMPKEKFPNHRKGDYGLYCVGFAQKGLFGISMDAKSIASDIKITLESQS